MPVVHNIFSDPATGSSYVWPINHDTEVGGGKNRTITHDANTGNVGLVRQQGDDEPLAFKFSGTILTLAQVQAFWTWFNLCSTRTIRLTDFTGDVYEVIITAFNPVRKRVYRNQRDLVNAATHIWTYDIEVEVISIISGSLFGLVTP